VKAGDSMLSCNKKVLECCSFMSWNRKAPSLSAPEANMIFIIIVIIIISSSSSISTLCLKKTDMPIMSHNSSKNRTVSMIFDTSNCPSKLDTFRKNY